MRKKTIMDLNKQQIAEWFEDLQKQICEALEKTDGKGHFEEDIWQREGGGGGKTRIMQNGNILAKGGVNFSAVFGELPEYVAKSLKVSGKEFFATGVSIVMHPINPFVPIIHMNIRYFELENGTKWFGGGIDLTPHYVLPDQAKWFHAQLKQVCEQTSPDYYLRFKKWADDYFFIKHRQETRGIGGIFFDRLQATETLSINDQWNFVQNVGLAFVPIYTKLMEQNKSKNYTEQHIEWQKLRRGRYVEFNLVYDKGTKFGLDTNGRTESILMSLPPEAQWTYLHTPSENSEEAQTLGFLKKGIDWI